ncbi:MAG: alpha/beta hydrolase [Niallia nealsonii]|nr:alpha/beta hydrolase [Niallia nealsonii]
MERKIEFFSTEGVTIEYSIIGKGEPILVMHGGHSNCNEEFGYDFLIENGFSVITPSRPGYGKTSKEVGKSLTIACEYYVKLLNRLNIKKVHILAISAGGPSGIYFAAKYPEYVRTLILQSAVTKEWLNPNDKKHKIAKFLFHPKFEKVTWKLISSMNNRFPLFIFKRMFPSFSTLKYSDAKNKIDNDDREAIRRMNYRQNSGYGFYIDLEQVNEITTEDLQAVSCPTLIMQSKFDGAVPIEHAYYAQKNILTSELCLIESWGHLIWLGKSSNETNYNLFSFLISHKIFN